MVGGQLGQDSDETSREDGEAATPEPARFFSQVSRCSQMEGDLMQLAWKLHEFNIFECGFYKMIYDGISDSIRRMMWYEMTETPGIVSWISGKIQAGSVYFFIYKMTHLEMLLGPADSAGH